MFARVASALGDGDSNNEARRALFLLKIRSGVFSRIWRGYKHRNLHDGLQSWHHASRSARVLRQWGMLKMRSEEGWLRRRKRQCLKGLCEDARQTKNCTAVLRHRQMVAWRKLTTHRFLWAPRGPARLYHNHVERLHCCGVLRCVAIVN